MANIAFDRSDTAWIAGATRGAEDPTRPSGPSPSTAAARRERRQDAERRSDEQLTIPLQEDPPDE